MSGTLTLLHLAGYVALLLWGIHMVHTGMLRAFGVELRRFLVTGLANRFKAFAAGVGITAILQSSTATGLMATGFMAGGLLALTPALAVMLGANIGSTVIVQLLTFDVWRVAPVFILAGVIAFKRSGRTRIRDLGRVGIGLGLVILSLHLIVELLRPAEQAEAMKAVLAILTGEPLLNVLMAAVLTWAMHSSVATVLLVMSLAAAHIVPPETALALVLGANIGAIIPQYLAAGTDNVARQLAVGNLIVRGVTCALALPLLPMAAGLMAAIEADPARQVADFHTLYNLACAVLFIGLLDPLARICIRLLPAPSAAADQGTPHYIGGQVPALASVALANAEREVLRMVDMIEDMLGIFLAALRDDDRKRLIEIERLDDTIDRLHRAVTRFITEIGRNDALADADARRCGDILAFSINLEHVGDILDKSLREIAAKKIKQRLSFSTEGFAEIVEMHQRLLADLRLAVGVFMTGDERTARTLLEEKVRIRDMEQAATQNHLRRLRDGRVESIETSSLHLDIIRDLKRIAAHVASAAYPVLDKNGLLLRSRVSEVPLVAKTG